MAIRVIITGSTGMVGEGVLYECLKHPDVETVLVINRKPCGVKHPKLKEIIHNNFQDMLPVAAKLHDYNACFFCLGVTSIGLKEPAYTKLTFDLTMEVAKTLVTLNPDLTFCYVSGAGTDSTERGSSMWARVKGRTENTLLKMPFKAAYMFRPGFIKPEPGMKHTHGFYKFITWMYPIFRQLAPRYVIRLSELGQAMISVTLHGYPKKVLEVIDIQKAANRS